MKKQTILAVLAASLFLVLMISGCVNIPPEKKTAIEDILAKAKDIGPVTYDSITTTFDGTIYTNLTKHIWEEPPYMKLNITGGPETTIFIKRPEGVYINIPNTPKFSRTNFTFPEPSLIEQANDLLTNISYQIVGNETINGNATTVLQYSINQSGRSITTKVWISNDKGIPLQLQTTIVMDTRTIYTNIVNTNFVFGSIPLSEFDLAQP